MSDVVIVGAGLAGLAAARTLQAQGAEVVLLDKGYRPGGRCATRTLEGARIDTGAQFFTVRSESFQNLTESLVADGCPIRVWSHGFAKARSIASDPSEAVTSDDGHPRYSVTGGMNRLAAHLAQGLDVRGSTRVTSVSPAADGWSIAILDRSMRTSTVSAPAVLLTPPVPQSLALLSSGGVEVPRDLAPRVHGLGYEPCLALMLVVDGDPKLPHPGGVQFDDGPVTWLGDNLAKGASTVPAVTVHAGASWSESVYDADPDIANDLLLDLLMPWLGPAEPVATQVFRWRYAKPRDPLDDLALVLGSNPGPLVLAGDALAGAKVEGAVTSGLAAAAILAG